MKIIKLKLDEVRFLESECQSAILNNRLEYGFFDEISAATVLMLNIDDIKIIANELMDCLMNKGIDENGEINELGKKIDDLIDRFNHYK